MLERLSLVDAASQVRLGKLSPVELVQHCLAQIARHESRVRAWVCLDRSRAIEEAYRKSETLQRLEPLGPLHGIPIGIKDIVDVAGFPTRAGSVLTSDRPATSDAPVVRRLRQAGAIVLGKTVTTEFAYIDPPPTRNPWALDHTPGGSSSGSAAVVAAGMCLGAVGTQTGGSLIRPAAYCGVVAFKPTFGRIGMEGVVPVSQHLDHLGVLARTARDVEIMFQSLLAVNDRAGYLPEELSPQESLPPRLGTFRSFFAENLQDDVRQAFEDALERLAGAGVQIGQVSLPKGFDRVAPNHRRIMAADAAAYHRKAFSTHRGEFGPRLADLLDEGLSVAEADYREARAHQQTFGRDLDEHFADCDAFVLPSTEMTAPATLETTGSAAFQLPWSYAGVPAITIPCGLAANGLPVGLQLIVRHGEDFRLLRIAQWCERQLAFDAQPPLDGRGGSGNSAG